MKKKTNVRKTKKRQIEESLAYLQSVFDTVWGPLLVLDPDLNVISANRSFYETFAVMPEVVEGRALYDLGNRQWDVPDLRAALDDVFRRGKPLEAFELERDFETIGRRTMMLNARLLREHPETGEKTALLAIEDVTDRRRAEKVQRELAAIVVGSDDAIVGKSLDGTITSWNAGAERIYGYAADEAVGQPITIVVPPDRRQEVYDILDKVKRGEKVGHFKTTRVRKDGKEIYVSLTVSPIMGAGGEIVGASTIARDVTELNLIEEELRRYRGSLEQMVAERTAELQKRNMELRRAVAEREEVQKALEASEQRFRLAAQAVSDIICEWDLATGSVEWFGDVDTMLGFEPGEFPRTFDAWMERIHPDDLPYVRDMVEMARSSTQPLAREFQIQRKDGSWRYWSVCGLPVRGSEGRLERWIGACRDITERRTIDERLRQTQKMEAIGQLAGGVAHDSNNILMAIMGHVSFVKGQVSSANPQLHEDLVEIEHACKRASGLTRQLLAFSRREIIEPRHINLNELVARMLKMLKRVIREDIEIQFMAGHELGTVLVDRGRIEQVLMNLCVNANDAMPEGGRLMIETENVLISSEYCRTHPYVEPGRYVQLSVTDSGCGMDKKTLDRVFEPFFTTKEPGKGTGLGLATVYGIIKQHGGAINAYSEPGKGTTFKIYLPMVDREAVQIGNKIVGPVRGGSETILVAEDDESVRNTAKRILEGAGYTVIVAADGLEAVETFKAHADEISLALLDVVMPKAGGRKVGEQIQSIDPTVRILFASGYTANGIHTQFVLEEGLHLIQKPYDPDSLLRKVRQLLDGTA